MISKHLLRPDRLRQIPTSFSWVDHRLIRHEHLRRADPTAWALYLFLLTVADAQGLSYYSDASIARHLNLEPLAVSAARQQLIGADLIAYRKPLYQVLALPEESKASVSSSAPRRGQTRAVGDILRRALQGGEA
jgi:hypothetical protein